MAENNFTNKAKSVIGRVGEKTGEILESSKLSVDILSMRKEKERLLKELGELVYEGSSQGDAFFEDNRVVRLIRALQKTDRQIEELKKDKGRVKNETLCSCGTYNPKANEFCVKCGRRLR